MCHRWGARCRVAWAPQARRGLPGRERSPWRRPSGGRAAACPPPCPRWRPRRWSDAPCPPPAAYRSKRTSAGRTGRATISGRRTVCGTSSSRTSTWRSVEPGAHKENSSPPSPHDNGFVGKTFKCFQGTLTLLPYTVKTKRLF